VRVDGATDSYFQNGILLVLLLNYPHAEILNARMNKVERHVHAIILLTAVHYGNNLLGSRRAGKF